MTKKIVRIEADQISCRKLTRKPYQMVSLFGRLYRLDDDFFIHDRKSNDCFIVYDLNGTQPHMTKPEYIDPNMTRAYIDSAKISGSKKSMWGRIGGIDWYKILVPIAIVGSLVYGFMMNGGF